MEEKNEFELIVCQGQRPLWKTLLAALAFAYMFYIFYGIITLFCQRGYCEYTSKALVSSVKIIAYCLSAGIALALTKDILIDVDKNLLISCFCVGIFSRRIYSKVPQLEYVSVFVDSRGFYQVNLWYSGNRHYKMYVFDEKDQAMKFAAYAAIKLRIDLLDATEKGNFHRIDKFSV